MSSLINIHVYGWDKFRPVTDIAPVGRPHVGPRDD